jgi:hypothetical protein
MNSPVPQNAAYADQLPSIGTAAQTSLSFEQRMVCQDRHAPSELLNFGSDAGLSRYPFFVARLALVDLLMRPNEGNWSIRNGHGMSRCQPLFPCMPS